MLAGCAGAADGPYDDAETDEASEEARAISVRRVRIPAAVDRAVTDNYTFGRQDADWGGISEVRTFQVEGGSARTLKTALRTVLLQSKSAEREGTTMSNYCKHEVGGEAARSATACVEHIMKHQESPRPFAPYFFPIEDPSDPQGEKFNRDVAAVKDYAERTVGAGFREFHYCYGEVPSVDTCQTLLTSKDGKAIVLINSDWGA